MSSLNINRWALVSGAGFAMLAVIVGAFAAHGLKPILNAYGLGLFEKAARYQMYHALAILIVGFLSAHKDLSPRWLSISALAFAFGIVLFSGSLYLLALTGIRSFGMITPIGGVLFILGWLALIVASLQRPGSKS
ncbi:MAG: DUF423 domain-containing protein [Gammaproteobacteria bacterium]|nr:DUF423 domain-containing protein [Gammaproteobacteria bacterium]